MSTPAQVQYSLSQDSAFQQRALMILLDAAIAVQAEAPATNDDTKKSQYAALVLNAPQAYLNQWAMGLATQTDPATGQLMTAAITDANLLAVANNLFLAFAGRV